MEIEQKIRELEETIKSLEQKISTLEKSVENHNGELMVISDFMNRSGCDGSHSAWDLIKEAERRNGFK
jgi:hypothetical protein